MPIIISITIFPTPLSLHPLQNTQLLNRCPPFLLLIGSMRCDASTPIAIDRPQNCYLRRPAYLLSPVLRLLCHHINIPVYLLLLYPLSRISTAAIVCRVSPLHYTASIPRLYSNHPTYLLRSSSHYLSSSHVIFRRHLYSFLASIFS